MIQATKRTRLHLLLAGVTCLAAVFIAACGPREEPADLILYGGPVLTMDAGDTVAEAVAVRNGRIVAVGSERAVLGLEGTNTRVVDLDGRGLLSGFIDSHGHVSVFATLAAAVNLAPPPVGPVADMADLVAIMQEALAAGVPEGGWLVGNGYDDSLLAEERHPTRDDLDRISTDRPILLLHTSLHMAVCNSACLATAGIDADTPDPAGGVIRRRPGSREPDGLLQERAMYLVLAVLPQPTGDEQLALLDAALDIYAANGFTTVQDGSTQPSGFQILQAAADAGRLKLDVVSYPNSEFWQAIVGERTDVVSQEYGGRFRVGGMKLVLDGSPQGRTAWLSEPYEIPPEGEDADYRGFGLLSDAQLEEFLLRVYESGEQILAHCNGDASADQFLEVYGRVVESLGPRSAAPTVMIHAQTVRADQLDRMRELGIMPSFFAAHVYFWGDWHRDVVLGPERANNISPTRWATDRGIRYTIHNDTPVVPPDPFRLIWSAVARRTRSDQNLGPDQRATVLEALRAMTIDGAYAYGEEAEKGSIEPGKRADLVVLSANPLAIEIDHLLDLEVVETIKDGVTVYQKPN